MIIGTCSICRGPVEMKTREDGVVSQCKDCGAVPQQNYGPVIPMKRTESPWKEINKFYEDGDVTLSTMVFND